MAAPSFTRCEGFGFWLFNLWVLGDWGPGDLAQIAALQTHGSDWCPWAQIPALHRQGGDLGATQKNNLRLHNQSKYEGINYNCDQCDYKASKQRFTNLENMRESNLALTNVSKKQQAKVLWGCKNNKNLKEWRIFVVNVNTKHYINMSSTSINNQNMIWSRCEQPPRGFGWLFFVKLKVWSLDRTDVYFGHTGTPACLDAHKLPPQNLQLVTGTKLDINCVTN